MDPVRVSIDVTAAPENVWNLVADLPRMGEWSPECTGVVWRDGAQGAAVGTRFTGKNRNGIRRWSTQGKITAATPGRELAWDISVLGLPGARWSYSIEPQGDGGCRVTETWEDRRGALLATLGRVATGVADRRAFNEASMRTTLERLKTAAEG